MAKITTSTTDLPILTPQSDLGQADSLPERPDISIAAHGNPHPEPQFLADYLSRNSIALEDFLGQYEIGHDVVSIGTNSYRNEDGEVEHIIFLATPSEYGPEPRVVLEGVDSIEDLRRALKVLEEVYTFIAAQEGLSREHLINNVGFPEELLEGETVVPMSSLVEVDTLELIGESEGSEATIVRVGLVPTYPSFWGADYSIFLELGSSSTEELGLQHQLSELWTGEAPPYVPLPTF